MEELLLTTTFCRDPIVPIISLEFYRVSGNTAIVADIGSMFHQVNVREEDQDSLRFLWWDGSTDEHLEEYVTTVHIF